MRAPTGMDRETIFDYFWNNEVSDHWEVSMSEAKNLF